MRTNLLRSIIFALLLFAFVGAQQSGTAFASLRAGTAKVDITPAEEVAVDIVGRPLKIRDSLFARVLVLKTEQLSLAIVSVDALVFASPKVIADSKKKWGVDHVILSATHTHAGMTPRGLVIQPPHAADWTRSGRAPADTLDWPGLSADPWYAATEEKIIAAIGSAMQNTFAAKLVSGKGPFESAYMAHNRRLVRDGKASPFWENPDRRPTQPVDPTVGVLRVDDLSGKPRAFAVHYACHPVALMGVGALSRDFPGAMVDHVEQTLGADCMAMFLQGAQGDLDPYDLHNLRGENRFNIAKQSGISLAKGALKLADSLKNSSEETRILAKESLLTIPNRDGKRSTEIGLLVVAINRELAFVTVPGEPFIQHQLDLTAQSPVKTSWILGLAYYGNGSPFVVYIPTVQAVQEGGYGATECSFVAANAGEIMVREAVNQIRKLTSEAK